MRESFLHAHRRASHPALPALAALAALALIGASSGCSAPELPGDPGAELGTSASAVTAADAIAAAEEWVAAKLVYCQSPNGADDSIDPSCAPICKRQSNPQWDPYRSDCSGLVSWAWGLPAPGRTTAEFAPNQSDITTVIQAADLAMGDAVNTDDSISSEHHIMLFKAWVTQGQTATFIEEPGCSATPDYAHEFTSAVTISGTSIKVAYNGISFKAIHYGALGSTSSGSSSSGAPPPACTAKGVAGVCIDTSVCASMAGHVSTPGLCPGPASEECCTPTGSAGSGSSSGGGSSGAGTGGAAGMGGAAGHGGNGIGHGIGAHSGCQVGPGDAPSSTAGLGLLAGLLLARRRRRAG